MSQVSYQSFLDGSTGMGAPATFRPLTDDDITTRKKNAGRELTVAISKKQSRWLREVDEISGRGVDAGAIVRAMLDVATHLDVDWALMAGGSSVRAAVRQSLLVREPTPSGPTPDAP